MDEKRMLFLWNPHSGKSKMKYSLEEVIRIFSSNGYEVTAIPTKEKKDATRIVAERGEGFDMVVCSGGDGTLTESISGLVKIEKKKRPVFAYIPSGTTNDVARSLGINSNITTAAKQIMDGNVQKMDIGRFNNANFTYCAAFGAFTEITYSTPQDFKNVLGHQAYMIGGVMSIQDIKPIPVQVEVEKEIVFEGSVLFGMISNSKSVGGFQYISRRDVSMSDGMFEVTLVSAISDNVQKNMAYLRKEITTRNPDPSLIHLYKARHIRIRFKEEIDWVFDGEYGGAHKACTIDNLYHEISIVVPKRMI